MSTTINCGGDTDLPCTIPYTYQVTKGPIFVERSGSFVLNTRPIIEGTGTVMITADNTTNTFNFTIDNTGVDTVSFMQITIAQPGNTIIAENLPPGWRIDGIYLLLDGENPEYWLAPNQSVTFSDIIVTNSEGSNNVCPAGRTVCALRCTLRTPKGKTRSPSIILKTIRPTDV